MLFMKLKFNWHHGWLMLMACGSPGSALAYHRLEAENGSGMVRRTMTTGASVPEPLGAEQ
jgi:hypothetical protein